ncbi:MAG: hypothetical protein GX410_04205 [Elusimicrobia bacterium]|nr:hypothetical protein [Elusimicrobiota bacterium]
MVRSVRGAAIGWLLFLVLAAIPAYYAAVHIRKFFSDEPLQKVDEESRRLRQARIEEYVRRNPQPKAAPIEAFKEEEEAKPDPIPIKSADEFADLRALNDAQRKAMTREHLSLIKGAIYQYRNERGKCPDKLEDLVPDYLLEMPPALIPGPLGTISKHVYNAADGKISMDGTGGWSYNVDSKDPDYCAVRPNSATFKAAPGESQWRAGN